MPVLLCNVLPNVTDTSHGAWRRLVSINFPTLFTSETITQPNEKRLDPNIDQKIEKWADGLLTYMLTNGYRKANGQPLNIPKSVETSTSTARHRDDTAPRDLLVSPAQTARHRNGARANSSCVAAQHVSLACTWYVRSCSRHAHATDVSLNVSSLVCTNWRRSSRSKARCGVESFRALRYAALAFIQLLA